jgi:hypothetical protein
LAPIIGAISETVGSEQAIEVELKTSRFRAPNRSIGPDKRQNPENRYNRARRMLAAKWPLLEMARFAVRFTGG